MPAFKTLAIGIVMFGFFGYRWSGWRGAFAGAIICVIFFAVFALLPKDQTSNRKKPPEF